RELRRLFKVIKSRWDKAIFLVASWHGPSASESGLLQRAGADLPRREGLFQADRQPVLVPPGDQRHTWGGADCGIGIGLQETQAFGRKAVDIGGAEITPPVAGHVGIAEIVGEDEQDVGL